jgi:N4-(beta-N-acetylglucosaminyl)-L-asparaginase
MVPAGLAMVGSWNAAPATAHAAVRAAAGLALLDAVVEGIEIIEDDPAELSVGYGGLPNEDGEVELDAAVMDATLHKAGAVAGLRGCRRAARVALEVLRRTDHALLVGEGASRFARCLGFREEDLMTEASRAAWLEWKASLSSRDGWITRHEGATGAEDPRAGDAAEPNPFAAAWAGHVDNPTPGGPPGASGDPRGAGDVLARGELGGGPRVPFTHGTVHVSARGADGVLCACTSTSGLSYKIAGRVGDTPMIGAGIYCEHGIGSAGATGRGEATLHACAAHEVVRGLERGREPVDACLDALRVIDRTTRQPRLRRDGKPAFNVTLYALRADGALGAAAIHPGYTFVAQRAGVTTLERAAALFAESARA